MDVEKILVLLFIFPLVTNAFIEEFCSAGLITECILLQLFLKWIPLVLAILGVYKWIKG